MADNETGEYHAASAGASATYPIQAGALKKNGYVVIKDRPCKIVEITTSKTGKHGHAKCHITAIDLFTGKKLEELCPSTHNINAPNVTRQDYQLIDITTDGFLNLLDDKSDPKDDVRVPEGEIGEKLRASFDEGKELVVSVIKAMGEEAVVQYKESTAA